MFAVFKTMNQESLQPSLDFLKRHIQPFSEESAEFYRGHVDMAGLFKAEKNINLPCAVWKCFMPPLTPSKPFIVSLSSHPAPFSLPHLEQSTNRAALDRQWHSFSSTHSPCGREEAVLTHKPEHWESQKTVRCIYRHWQNSVGRFLEY